MARDELLLTLNNRITRLTRALLAVQPALSTLRDHGRLSGIVRGALEDAGDSGLMFAEGSELTPMMRRVQRAESLVTELAAVLGDAHRRGELGSPHHSADGTAVDIAALLGKVHALGQNSG